MNPTLRTHPWVLAALLAAACAGQQAVTSGAIAEVTVPGWRLSPAATIGGADARADQQLYTVTSVADDPEGRMYVVNFGDKRVAVFDSAGVFVRNLGRAGRGPGEFLTPSRVAVAGPEAWVLDVRHGRVSRFRRSDGGHVGDLPLRVGAGLRVSDIKTTPDGRLFVEVRPLRTGRSRGAVQPRVVEVDTATGTARHAAAVPLDTVSQVEVRTATGPDRGIARVMDIPFAPRPVWAVDPDGVVLFGNGAEYVVRSMGDGRVGELFRAAGERSPVTAWDREELFEEPMLKPFRGKVKLPKRKPFFTSLLADGDRVWVALPTSREGQRWEVRDRGGRLLGELRLAPRARLAHVSSTAAYVVTMADDLETLRRYSLRRG